MHDIVIYQRKKETDLCTSVNQMFKTRKRRESMDQCGWLLAIEPKQFGSVSLEKAKKGYDEVYIYIPPSPGIEPIDIVKV